MPLLQMLSRWLGNLNRPRTTVLPPPLEPYADDDDRARDARLSRIREQQRRFEIDTERRVLRLEAQAEAARLGLPMPPPAADAVR